MNAKLPEGYFAEPNVQLLLARLTEDQAYSSKLNLYAVAYRAIARNGQPSLDIWQEELAIGSILPTLPL